MGATGMFTRRRVRVVVTVMLMLHGVRGYGDQLSLFLEDNSEDMMIPNRSLYSSLAKEDKTIIFVECS